MDKLLTKESSNKFAYSYLWTGNSKFKQKTVMWKTLDKNERDEYKKMILAFASLTEMFAQKADETDNSEIILSPIINSKYQETVFQRVFHASAEDIGNTSYDASIAHKSPDGKVTKYIIGIKTFGINSGAQKIAQFKANHDEWSELINQIRQNAKNPDGSTRTKEEINSINLPLYLELATRISKLRNMRIDSSEANLHGFSVSVASDKIEAVYHVLMPSKKCEPPFIYVGETSYNRVDLQNLTILGCTNANNPTNFEFSDGKHKYKYTAADSQLYMDFDNKNIVQDEWEVHYADDAYKIFAEIADRVAEDPKIVESYSWLITNKNNEVELFSGFNNFFGVGSKLGTQERSKRIAKLQEKYSGKVNAQSLNKVIDQLTEFLGLKAPKAEDKQNKIKLRKNLLDYVDYLENDELKQDIAKLLFRPKDEIYIPIPNSVKFHTQHPDFFSKGVGNLKRTNESNWKLPLPKEQCKFTLVFEPSGNKIESYITQDAGKAIESWEKQSYLGNWILRKIFQLQEYEPLTIKRLNEIQINGIRLEKRNNDNSVHIYFIWIDKENPPADFIGE